MPASTCPKQLAVVQKLPVTLPATGFVQSLRRSVVGRGCQLHAHRALRTRHAPASLCNTQRDWLVKLRDTEGTKAAVQLAGPFVLTFQGPPGP